MKRHDLESLRNADAKVLHNRLELHCADLRARVQTATGQIFNPPNIAFRGGLLGRIRNLEYQATELEKLLGDEAPIFEFSAAQAALRSPGSAAGGLILASSKKLSLTEQVLKTRGVGSLEELRTSLSDMSHEEKMQSARRLKPGA